MCPLCNAVIDKFPFPHGAMVDKPTPVNICYPALTIPDRKPSNVSQYFGIFGTSQSMKETLPIVVDLLL